MQMKKQNNRKGLIIFLLILGLAIFLAVCATLAKNWAGPGSGHESPYHSGQENVAIVSVVGTISNNDGRNYDQAWLLETISDLSWDEDNKGILLYIDSPGGGVYQSDEVYLALCQYKESTSRPVYTAMGPLAASGGYYIAAASDKIYANRNTLTGSIGVLAGSSIDLTGLMEKWGIKMTTTHSGKNKNMSNFNEPFTPEQAAIMQSVSDEAYDQFTEIVAESRHLPIDQVRTLADGRIYTAKQALENGLIDGIADYYETQDMMRANFDWDETVVFNEWSYNSKAGFDVWSLLQAPEFPQQAGAKQINRILDVFNGMPLYYAPLGDY